MKQAAVILIGLSISFPAAAESTWYVRTDGGNPTQCDGLHDAPYTGGSNACAFSDVNYALGFRDSKTYRDPASVPFQGGDTLIIDDVKHADNSRASYTQGADMPALVYGVCDTVNDRSDCDWAAIPGGPDKSHPSRILGKQWNTGCAQKPLLSEEGLWAALTIGGSNIQLSCLDFEGVDISAPPHRGTWGIYADPASDITNLVFSDIDVHGFRGGGILLGIGNNQGNIGDVTMDGVRAYGNAGSGIGTNNPGNGTITITNSAVEWSGCYEKYPLANTNIDDPANYYWCFSQGQNGTDPYAGDQGYGDGIAFGPSGNQPSGNWVLDRDSVRWNTQDGFDTIHGTAGGYIDVTRSWFEGNAGAAVKIAASTSKIENNLLIADCGFFDSQPFTAPPSAGGRFMSCRAGSAVGFPAPSTADIEFYNNTVFSNQDIIIGYFNSANTCTPNTHYRVKNNIFIGGTDWLSDVESVGDWDLTDAYYEEGCDQATFEEDYNVGTNVKHPEKFAGAHDKYADPKFVGAFAVGPSSGPSGNPALYYQGTTGGAQFYLSSGSPAVGAGTSLPDITVDFNNFPRANPPSVGAYELGSVPVDGGSGADGGATADGGGNTDGGSTNGPQPTGNQGGCSCSLDQTSGGNGAWAWLLALALIASRYTRGAGRRES
ncbi:MAG TPA: hypothetical protein VGH28_18295 [Polyangiaceae bacterium]|jgi:MYXO-CTERM domain-containing protein